MQAAFAVACYPSFPDSCRCVQHRDQALAGRALSWQCDAARTLDQGRIRMFALSYSVLHFGRLIILPSSAVHRYGPEGTKSVSEYLRLMVQVNATGGLLLMSLVLIVVSRYWIAPAIPLWRSAGPGVTVGVSSQRTFSGEYIYIQRQPRSPRKPPNQLVTVACGFGGGRKLRS